MTITYLGSLSVGGAVPGASAAITAGLAGINAALDNLLAQLEALNGFVPNPSLDFAAQLALAQSMVASVTAAITAGISPPSIAAQLAIIAGEIATLTAQITGIQANLDELTDLQAPLAAAGVHAYAFDGDVNQIGSEFAAELSGGFPGGSGGDHCNALLLATSIGATWAAMGEILQVTP